MKRRGDDLRKVIEENKRMKAEQSEEVDIEDQPFRKSDPLTIPEVYGVVMSCKSHVGKKTTFVKISIVDTKETIKKVNEKIEKLAEDKRWLSAFVINNTALKVPIKDKLAIPTQTTKRLSYVEQLSFLAEPDNLIKDGNMLKATVKPNNLPAGLRAGDKIRLVNVMCANSKLKPDIYYINADKATLATNPDEDYLKTKFFAMLEVAKDFDSHPIERITQSKLDWDSLYIILNRPALDFYYPNVEFNKHVDFRTEQTHSLLNTEGKSDDPKNWGEKMQYVIEVLDYLPNNKVNRIAMHTHIYSDELVTRGFPNPKTADLMMQTHEFPAVFIIQPDVKAMEQKQVEDWLFQEEPSEDTGDSMLIPMNYKHQTRGLGVFVRYNEYLKQHGVDMTIDQAIYYLICKSVPIDQQKGYMVDLEDYCSLKKPFTIPQLEKPTENYLNKSDPKKDLYYLDVYRGKSMEKIFTKEWSFKLLIGCKGFSESIIKQTVYDESGKLLLVDLISCKNKFNKMDIATMLFAVKI